MTTRQAGNSNILRTEWNDSLWNITRWPCRISQMRSWSWNTHVNTSSTTHTLRLDIKHCTNNTLLNLSQSVIMSQTCVPSMHDTIKCNSSTLPAAMFGSWNRQSPSIKLLQIGNDTMIITNNLTCSSQEVSLSLYNTVLTVKMIDRKQNNNVPLCLNSYQ